MANGPPLYGLSAWRETPYYSERERAALEWTDALTLVSETHVPDDVYERVRAQFTEAELVGLTFAVITIKRGTALRFRSARSLAPISDRRLPLERREP